MLIYFSGLALGLIALVLAADRFVMGSTSIARLLGVSPLIIGITIVGLGTSAPEMLVSAIAAFQGTPQLAIGNALGSNITNIGLILGITAIVSPLVIQSRLLTAELPVLLNISLVCYGLSYYGGLQLIDGVLMLLALVAFLSWLIRLAARQRGKDAYTRELQHELASEKPLGTHMAISCFLTGLIALILSSRLLVWSAVNIAHEFGVSELIIGLTVVALGTSLPELAANIMSVLKNEADLAIGNIIGSNIFNLLAVYALPALIQPEVLPDEVLYRDFPWMLGFTALLLFFGFLPGQPKKISRLSGTLLLFLFGIYMFTLTQSIQSA